MPRGRPKSEKHAEFTTTVGMSFDQRADLDRVKNARHIATGKRPTQSDLLLEALKAFLDKELRGA